LKKRTKKLLHVYESYPAAYAKGKKFFGSFFQKRTASLLLFSAAPFLTTPNEPLPAPLPVISTALPGDGLTLTPNSRPAFTLILGTAQPGANLTTPQSVRDRFFLNYISGDLTRAIGSPMDTGQADNSIFAAIARHTAPGAPGDLHVMAPDGLHLRAVCADHGADCRPGHIYAAMIRLPFEIRPGMTLKIRYRAPAGPHAWAPIWMFTGQQRSPGPGGDPYQGFGGPNALLRLGTANAEIDWNDDYPRLPAGVPPAEAVDFGTPDIYGTKWRVKPHAIYRANTNGWRFYGPSYKPEFERAPFNWATGFHDLVGNWRGDGSNLIDLIVDGKLVATQYMEYPQSTYIDPADGSRKQVAMHLIIGNQAVPAFSPGASQVRDNDGIPDGWTITVQEIAGWYGNVQHPDTLK
jgi:hypothetical protein